MAAGLSGQGAAPHSVRAHRKSSRLPALEFAVQIPRRQRGGQKARRDRAADAARLPCRRGVGKPTGMAQVGHRRCAEGRRAQQAASQQVKATKRANWWAWCANSGAPGERAAARQGVAAAAHLHSSCGSEDRAGDEPLRRPRRSGHKQRADVVCFAFFFSNPAPTLQQSGLPPPPLPRLIHKDKITAEPQHTTTEVPAASLGGALCGGPGCGRPWFLDAPRRGWRPSYRRPLQTSRGWPRSS